MPNVVIRSLFCVHAATGTDAGLNAVIAGIPESLEFLAMPSDAQLQGVIRAIPGLIDAIDAARADPDDLYLTNDTSGGVENRIWPIDKKYHPVNTNQLVTLGVAIAFEDKLNLSLWDHDSSSDDDLLGSIVIDSVDVGKEMTKKAWSEIESSVYLVSYLVY